MIQHLLNHQKDWFLFKKKNNPDSEKHLLKIKICDRQVILKVMLCQKIIIS